MNEWRWTNGELVQGYKLELETVAAGLVEITSDCDTEEEALAVMLEAVTVGMEYWETIRNGHSP